MDVFDRHGRGTGRCPTGTDDEAQITRRGVQLNAPTTGSRKIGQ